MKMFLFSFRFVFLLYNNESHFVITKYCLNALRSHTLPHIYLRVFSIPKYKIEINILLIICSSNKCNVIMCLRQTIVYKTARIIKKKVLHACLLKCGRRTQPFPQSDFNSTFIIVIDI